MKSMQQDQDISIVYVEDDAMSREVMKLMLKDALGYSKVEIYEDTTDIMQKVEALTFLPDIIFLDIHMKPIDGFEVLSRMRNHPRFRYTRIVALTASVMNEEVKRLRTAGFDGVISKPINQKVFPGQIERIVKGEKIWQI